MRAGLKAKTPLFLPPCRLAMSAGHSLHVWTVDACSLELGRPTFTRK